MSLADCCLQHQKRISRTKRTSKQQPGDQGYKFASVLLDKSISSPKSAQSTNAHRKEPTTNRAHQKLAQSDAKNERGARAEKEMTFHL